MAVIATARTRPPGTVEVTFVDTPTLLADSDVITVHTPLPPQTNLELRNLHPNRTAALPRAVRTPGSDSQLKSGRRKIRRNLSPDVATQIRTGQMGPFHGYWRLVKEVAQLIAGRTTPRCGRA
jgi:hypothetical protein